MIKNRRLRVFRLFTLQTGLVFFISQVILSGSFEINYASFFPLSATEPVSDLAFPKQRLNSASMLASTPPPSFSTKPHSWIESTSELEEKLSRQSNWLAAEEPANSLSLDDQNIDPETTTGPVINFNNVSMTEYIRFVSKLTGKNFIFDEQDLDFNVTIVSEAPTTLELIITVLVQNLRIHDLQLMEQGNNYIIYKNEKVSSPGTIIDKSHSQEHPQVVTQVFHILNVPAERILPIIKPLLSQGTQLESLKETNRIVITDIAYNIRKIAELLKSLDAPEPGFDIGQYVATNTSLAALTSLAQRILTPIAKDRPLTLVPHPASNSIFIVSTPYLVERALSVMKTLDSNEAISRILNFDNMRFQPHNPNEVSPEDQDLDSFEESGKLGKNKRQQGGLGRNGNKNNSKGNKGKGSERPYGEGKYGSDQEEDGLGVAKRGRYGEGHGEGRFSDDMSRLDAEGNIRPSSKRWAEDVPLGQVDSTQFYIYKLQYRKCTDLSRALKAIAISLQTASSNLTVGSTSPSDLVTTLNSVQAIEDNNSLVVTGTKTTLNKAKELISQIDTPVKQVFIEMLVLDTSVSNSLNFGVEWAVKTQRRGMGGALGLIGPTSNMVNVFEGVTQTTPNPLNTIPLKNGFQAGSIGRTMTLHGKGFVTTAGLIKALSTDQDTHIVMNPKLTTEHNVSAEIFVGKKISFKGQSIVNNNSDVITSNFEYRDVGHSLKVTPLLGNNNIVTLIIDQSISETTSDKDDNNNTTTVETKNIARVHLPSDCFLVMSGMIEEKTTKATNRVPCLGGLPILGALFQDNTGQKDKRNLLIFVRPHIIGNEDDMKTHTKRQEDIWREKSNRETLTHNEWAGFIEFLNL